MYILGNHHIYTLNHMLPLTAADGPGTDDHRLFLTNERINASHMTSHGPTQTLSGFVLRGTGALTTRNNATRRKRTYQRETRPWLASEDPAGAHSKRGTAPLSCASLFCSRTCHVRSHAQPLLPAMVCRSWDLQQLQPKMAPNACCGWPRPPYEAEKPWLPVVEESPWECWLAWLPGTCQFPLGPCESLVLTRTTLTKPHYEPKTTNIRAWARSSGPL